MDHDENCSSYCWCRYMDPEERAEYRLKILQLEKAKAEFSLLSLQAKLVETLCP